MPLFAAVPIEARGEDAMKTRMIGAAIAAVLAPACVSDEEMLSEEESEVVGGDIVSAEGSGDVRLRMIVGNRICSGTLVTNRTVLTARQCIAGEFPGSIEVVMGSQARGVTAIRVHPTLDIAVLDMQLPMTMAGSTTNYQANLYPLATNTLTPGTVLRCRGFGEAVWNTNVSDGFLRTADLPVRGVSFQWWGWSYDLGVNSNARGQFLGNLDVGGSCTLGMLTGERVIAGVTSIPYKNWDATFAGLVGAESFRGWFAANVTPSTDGAAQWGTAGDIPLVADYDGDGADDLVVYRPSSNEWWISNTRGITRRVWGAPGDLHLAVDLDGFDHRPDYVRFNNGLWSVLGSATGNSWVFTFGQAGDVPVPADYDGDTFIDFAYWRPSTGEWHVRRSSDYAIVTRQWGTFGDKPIVADYDRDGRADFAVWRPWTGEWFIIDSSTGIGRAPRLGSASDTPMPGLVRCNRNRLTVFRPSPAGFLIGGVPFPMGQAGDVPLIRRRGPGDFTLNVWRPSTGMWFTAAGRVTCN
jgi:hypothetical protein